MSPKQADPSKASVVEAIRIPKEWVPMMNAEMKKQAQNLKVLGITKRRQLYRWFASQVVQGKVEFK